MYFEIYTTERSRKDPRKAFRRFPSVRRTGKNMYRIQAEERKERKIRRICRRRHYELKRIYPENLGRSDHYRRDFFSYYPRPLAAIAAAIVIAVFRIKSCASTISTPSTAPRPAMISWLRLLRIEDVNDVRNLAPACRRCNTKKGRNAGIWVLRAILGRYEAYWVLRKVCFVALVVGLVFLLNFFS